MMGIVPLWPKKKKKGWETRARNLLSLLLLVPTCTNRRSCDHVNTLKEWRHVDISSKPAWQRMLFENYVQSYLCPLINKNLAKMALNILTPYHLARHIEHSPNSHVIFFPPNMTLHVTHGQWVYSLRFIKVSKTYYFRLLLQNLNEDVTQEVLAKKIWNILTYKSSLECTKQAWQKKKVYVNSKESVQVITN